ncbi:unnamed protein product [Caenorhabditis bovis]|uniref:Nuclear pore complex protein Nup98-Nup96 n=1 Tax=Caenorhabditis bovis TaxID=2654633 RepID=A0A8S1EP12_9PELO|nr:unnamed protein product [Caenorhabditis bovis]
MFGQNKTFGSSSFGSTSTTGGSLFGSSNQNKSSIFGSSSGTTNTGGGLFGSANKPAGSLFGGNTQQSTSIFGSPQQQNTGSSIFGSNQNKSIFGSSTTNTGSTLFGGSSSSTNTGGSSLFGNSSNQTTGGLFGGGSVVNGTTIKFEPPVGQDTMMRNGSTQSISTKHMCITAMSKYDSKSIEELRIEDYIANRKTPGSGTTTGGGLFGGASTTTQSGGLFGSNTPQKSLFGSTNTASPFGSGNNNAGSSIFGNTSNQQSGSLFGSKPATGGLFGSNTGTSTFGQTNTGGSLFGNTQQQSGGSLFGNNSQPQQQTGSLFGNTSNTGTSLFGGQPQQSGFSFGGSGTTFGQPAASNAGTSLFGNTNTQAAGTSLFGSKPATSGFGFGITATTTTNNAFGQPAASGSLFGSTATKPGGLFGNTNTGTTGTSLFGSQPAANTGTGLFGSTTQPANSIGGFGLGAQQQVAVAQPQVAPVPVIGVTADVLQMQANMKSLQSQLTAAPYGDSPLLKYNASLNEGETGDAASAKRQIRFLAAKKAGSDVKEKSSFISNSISKVMGDLSPAVNNKKSSDVTNDLNYTSKEAPPTLGRGLRTSATNNTSIIGNTSLNDTSVVNRTLDTALEASLNGSSNRLGVRGSVRKSNLKQLDLSVLSDASKYTLNVAAEANDPDALPLLQNSANNEPSVETPQNHPIRNVIERQQDRDRQPPALNLDETSDETSMNRSAITTSATSVVTAQTSLSDNDKSICGVRLTKSDYFTIPSIAEMRSLVKDGVVVIEDGLTIGRSSYGSVFWPGRIELKDVVLDEIVIFRHKEVTVYPNEDEKPEEGQGLNKPAEVTLERVWYTDKKTKKEIRDVVELAERGWREHLERQTIRMGASFKDYRPETGSWVFRVEHFSKYGLADDDDEPMDVAPPSENQPLQPINMNTSPRDVQSQVQRQRIRKLDVSSQQIASDSEIAVLPPLPPRANHIGLGGGIDHDAQQLANVTIEYQVDDGEQPEKKPKIEMLIDLEYESSKYLKHILDVKSIPKCVEAQHRFTGGISETKTIGYKKSKYIDLALVKGRSCRVGWSAMGTIVCSAQPEDNQILWGTVDRGSDVKQGTLRSMLLTTMMLSESRRKGPPSTVGENEYEKLSSNFIAYNSNYDDLLETYYTIASEDGYESHRLVWKLCSALFPKSRDGDWMFQRGENVAEWLQSITKIHKRNVPNSDKAGKVWQELTLGNKMAAFEIATEENMLNLASSIYAYSICPETTVHCYRKQIEVWQEKNVLHHLEPSLLKCYLVLAGMSYKEWLVNGKKHTINCLEGLHWTQALGIHMWYIRGWKGLEDAYAEYRVDVDAKRAHSNTGDLYGELIKLAVESQHSVEVVLDCAAGESPHDHFLMWHVWCILHNVGYRTMSKSAETRLHRSYAAQLENADLVKYAIFVLQHIENDSERAGAVQAVLERVASSSTSESLEELMMDCFIQPEWIADAQYTAFKSLDDSGQLFELALRAKNFREAQNLFVNSVAPTAIVIGDFETLRIACRLLKPYENLIPEWGARGQIYSEFCDLLRLTQNDEADEDVQNKIRSIENRLHAPIFNTSVQKIALQTIARHLFEYRVEADEIPDWSRLLGPRQTQKILRDIAPAANGHLTIDFD